MKKSVLLSIVLPGIAICMNVFAVDPVVDSAVYNSIPKDGDYSYELKSKWLYSATIGNYGGENVIGPTNTVRGMIAKDGKMYFINRDKKGITVVNGETGKTEKTIILQEGMFTYVDENGETKTAGTLEFNDIKMDNAGNVLVGNCVNAYNQHFQVWKVDLETGNGTLLLDEFVLHEDPHSPLIRFDAFGVYGDVDGDAVILAADANAMFVYKWKITGGTVGEVEDIQVDTKTGGTYLTGKENPGAAPQVFPIEKDHFYLDGQATYPTLIDFKGQIKDGFYNAQSHLKDSTTSLGNTWVMDEGNNGLARFELDGEFFILMAASNYDKVPPSTFRLFKFANSNKEFAGMTCMWTFPQEGMGVNQNSYRTAVPSVEVDGKTARLYLYMGENGYGMYEFTVQQKGAINGLSLEADVNISTEGLAMIFSEVIATAQIYNISGQLVREIANTNTAQVSAKGVYIVKLTTEEGLSAIRKVVVH